MRGKNQKNLKIENTSIILKLIRDNPGISRADIVRSTNLAPPTVSRIVSYLSNRNLVLERVNESNGVGRKPYALFFHGKTYYVLSVNIVISRIDFALVNLEGEIIDKLSIPTSQEVTNEELLALIKEKSAELMKKYERKKVIGIGVSSPGRIDGKKGIIMSAPNLKTIKNVSIAENLSKHFRLPVFVQNDANAEALSEKYFGSGKQTKDFVLIHVGFGIGAGVVLDSRLYSGNFGVSGEIGHFSIDAGEGKECVCGNRGCLELYAGIMEIIKKCSAQEKREFISLDEIAYEIEKGNARLLEIVKEAGNMVGEVLLQVVNFLAPLKIIVTGPVASLAHYFLDPLKDVIKNRSFYGFGKEIEVVYSSLGEDSGLIAGMTIVFDAFLEHPYAFL